MWLFAFRKLHSQHTYAFKLQVVTFSHVQYIRDSLLLKNSSFKRILLPFARKLTCNAPAEFLLVCLKTLLRGGADFTGARGGKQSSSTTFLSLIFLGFRWLNVASLTILGIGRGLLILPSIEYSEF